MSASDHFCSPPEIADPLFDFFGGPADCDPATNPASIIQATVMYTVGGLHLPWGKKPYNTPPYSGTGPWFAKGHIEIEANRVRELVALVMATTGTGWWRSACG